MNIINEIIAAILDWFYRFSGDYGLAIVGVTLAIRLLLLPLNLKQHKSMEKQQTANAELAKLKEKYKNNPKKLNEETMKYMQANGTGMGGCLLLLLQLPIMFSLNAVIRNHVNGTVATFLLPWIGSLSLKDPYFILPILTILVQLLPQLFAYLPCFKQLHLQKSKGGMMIYLVLMNGIFAISIPSGLGLYWFVSGAYTFLEQLCYHVLALRKHKKITLVNL